jgi:hypothetical protein
MEITLEISRIIAIIMYYRQDIMNAWMSTGCLTAGRDMTTIIGERAEHT